MEHFMELLHDAYKAGQQDARDGIPEADGWEDFASVPENIGE